MAKIMRLPNGDWIDPVLVTGILVGEIGEELAKNTGTVAAPYVMVFSGKQASQILFDPDDDAQAWADRFAEQVNESRR
jgi:hypothetical protein